MQEAAGDFRYQPPLGPGVGDNGAADAGGSSATSGGGGAGGAGRSGGVSFTELDDSGRAVNYGADLLERRMAQVSAKLCGQPQVL